MCNSISLLADIPSEQVTFMMACIIYSHGVVHVVQFLSIEIKGLSVNFHEVVVVIVWSLVQVRHCLKPLVFVCLVIVCSQ